MEEILKSIGWKELYPGTLKRLTFFRDSFREYYSEEQISNSDLDKCIAYTFGIYGQDEVYSIYMTALKDIEENKTLCNVFSSFVDAFSSTLKTEEFKVLKPSSFIDLFIEYIFSVYIKL